MSRWAAFLIVAFGAAVLLALTGCNSPATPQTPEERSRIAIYTDEATGCQYIRPLGYAGFTPRMDRDGKQVCK